MERYESIFVAQPRMSEDEFESLRQTYEQLIRTNGGSVSQSENWGKRRLAYRISKHEEGYYGFLLFDGTGSLVKELERRFRLNEEVIKFISVKAPPEGLKIVGGADFRPRRSEEDRPAEETGPRTGSGPAAEAQAAPAAAPREPKPAEPAPSPAEPETAAPATPEPEREGE